MKRSITLLLTTILVILLSACGSNNTSGNENITNNEATKTENQEETEKQEDEAPEEEEATAEGAWETQVGETIENEGGSHTLIKRFDQVESKETGPIILNIPQINTISSQLKGEMAEFLETDAIEYIQIDMEVENTSEETISFYADQATITTNTGEQLESDMWLSDYIDGDYIGAVKKSGSLFFILNNSNAEDIEWVRIIIEAPHDENWDSVGEKIDFQVDFN